MKINCELEVTEIPCGAIEKKNKKIPKWISLINARALPVNQLNFSLANQVTCTIWRHE